MAFKFDIFNIFNIFNIFFFFFFSDLLQEEDPLPEVPSRETEVVVWLLGDDVAQVSSDPHLGRVHHAPGLAVDEIAAARVAAKTFFGAPWEWCVVVSPRVTGWGRLYVFSVSDDGLLRFARSNLRPDGSFTPSGGGRARPFTPRTLGVWR